jgi:hypothetical protein
MTKVDNSAFRNAPLIVIGDLPAPGLVPLIQQGARDSYNDLLLLEPHPSFSSGCSYFSGHQLNATCLDIDAFTIPIAGVKPRIPRLNSPKEQGGHQLRSSQ